MFFLASQAEAIKIDKAEVSKGIIEVKGDKAAKKATIFWEGDPVATSDRKGGFKFKTTNLPQDCRGELSDGVNTIDVVIKKCTIEVEQIIQSGAVPQTGQTQCYDGGTPGDCPNGPAGQDGDYQAGVEVPSPRFTDNLNGTVMDNLTGLIWLQDWNCLGFLTWANALAAANALAHGQWVLPTGAWQGTGVCRT